MELRQNMKKIKKITILLLPFDTISYAPEAEKKNRFN